jgi:cytochrome c
MRNLFFTVSLFYCLFSLSSCTEYREKKRILVFSKTSGARHESISEAKNAILKLGKNFDFEVDTSENSSVFVEDKLKDYSAVVFLCTTGDILDKQQQIDFERYIQAGGGYMGVHSAVGTEYDWAWYGRLVGAYLDSPSEIQEADLYRSDHEHIATQILPEKWHRRDEWYNYKSFYPKLKVVLKLDEKSYKGGKNGDNHPIAWFHEYDGGRSFYTGCGHTVESYREELFLKHLLGGIEYVIGENKVCDYSKATSQK